MQEAEAVKYCPRCKQHKALSDFNRWKHDRTHGRQVYCKDCHREIRGCKKSNRPARWYNKEG